MSSDLKPEGMTLRERTREAVREQVRAEALRLFITKGFDSTTTEDIAQAVGISTRSFFRYFPTKEDVIVGGSIEFGQEIVAAFQLRPVNESVWESLEGCLSPLVDGMTVERERGLSMMRVIMGTASLRAYHFEKHLAWAEALVPEVADRIGGPQKTRQLRAAAVCNAAMGCLDAALGHWVDADGEPPFAEVVHSAFTSLTQA